MKYFLMILFFLIALTLNAQDIIDPQPLLFDFKDNVGTMHNDAELKPEYFLQENFIIGWQWGSVLKTVDELNTNMVHAYALNCNSFLISESVVIFNQLTINSGIRNIFMYE